MRDSRLKPFPGNSQDKSAARLFLYKHATTAPQNGAAITLAGHEPREELSLLRDYLHWPASSVWFVDYNTKDPRVKRALNAVHLLWPGVNSYFGNLLGALSGIDMIGFANLDFMGHLTADNVLPCLQEVTERMLPSGILGLTWERGREQLDVKNHSGTRTVKAGSKRGRSLNDKRWAGVLQIVEEISDGDLEFLAGFEYQSNHSPMSVSVFRKT